MPERHQRCTTLTIAPIGVRTQHPLKGWGARAGQIDTWQIQQWILSEPSEKGETDWATRANVRLIEPSKSKLIPRWVCLRGLLEGHWLFNKTKQNKTNVDHDDLVDVDSCVRVDLGHVRACVYASDLESLEAF